MLAPHIVTRDWCFLVNGISLICLLAGWIADLSEGSKKADEKEQF